MFRVPSLPALRVRLVGPVPSSHTQWLLPPACQPLHVQVSRLSQAALRPLPSRPLKNHAGADAGTHLHAVGPRAEETRRSRGGRLRAERGRSDRGTDSRREVRSLPGHRHYPKEHPERQECLLVHRLSSRSLALAPPSLPRVSGAVRHRLRTL